MFYYKDPSDNTYRLDSKEFEPSLPAGCVEITEAEVATIKASRVNVGTLTPLQEIRALEAAAADHMARGTRLVALEASIDIAVRKASDAGLTCTRAQAQTWLLANDANYKALYDLEQAVRPLRALIP
jgi:hypothetical protein